MSTIITSAAAGSVASNNAAMTAATAINQRIAECHEDPQCEVLVVQQCNEYGAIEYGFVAALGLCCAIMVWLFWQLIRG